MSDTVLQVLSGCAFAVLGVVLARAVGLGAAREIAVTGLRALVQLAVVGAAIALVFEVPVLSVLFVAVMVATAGLTAGARVRALPGARRCALAAIALPALAATGALLAVGAFDFTPRAAVPTAGILIGGAMAAVTVSGRRLLEGLRDDVPLVEARLLLGDDARTALAPTVRGAVYSGIVPVLDQTRSVGLVALPGTFVGLVLGGASPAEAAATQFVVLLTLVAVELAAATLLAELTQRAVVAEGDRIVVPAYSVEVSITKR